MFWRSALLVVCSSTSLHSPLNAEIKIQPPAKPTERRRVGSSRHYPLLEKMTAPINQQQVP